MIWYGFYDLRSGNGVGPILTAPEPTRGEINGESMSMVWPTLGSKMANEHNRIE